ncbi:MAG: terpene cyclase/mutase family protein [Clostridiaceae bacterium]|nr:terpene cyclase/mutase family protein [Clostridiaceae bacterium]
MLKRKNKYILLVLAMSAILWQSSVKASEVNKEITDVNKAWNIKFSQDIELNDDVKNSITIQDSKGNSIVTNIRMSDNKTIVVDAPKEGYKEGETYTLNIGDKVHSKNNKSLKENVKCVFKVTKGDSKTSNSDKYKESIDSSMKLSISKILQPERLQKEGLSDWQVIGIARHGEDIPSIYLNSLENKIDTAKGAMGQATDYERTVLGLLSVGQDPTNFKGYNLVEKIYNNEEMDNQGINAYIFGLIALDAGKFDVPSNALWTRDKLIQAILDNRTVDKGWDYAGDKADPDMTGMALTALAPYKNRVEAKVAVEEAIKKLSSMQKENGGFASWGTENSESISQVIIALCANGIDPTSDSRFVKNGKNPLDVLLEYRTEEGGFSHIKGTGYNAMATEQAMEALEAYKMFKEGKGSIYSFK